MKKNIEKMEGLMYGYNCHFIITVGKKRYFQSFGSLIAVENEGKVTLNRERWNYSKTTAAYRNRFLGVSNKECNKKVASGEYRLRKMDSNILRKLNPDYFDTDEYRYFH